MNKVIGQTSWGITIVKSNMVAQKYVLEHNGLPIFVKVRAELCGEITVLISIA